MNKEKKKGEKRKKKEERQLAAEFKSVTFDESSNEVIDYVWIQNPKEDLEES